MSYHMNTRGYSRGRARPYEQGPSSNEHSKRFRSATTGVESYSAVNDYVVDIDPSSSGERYGQEAESRVLLFTVIDATYPITVDVMKSICNPCGKVLKIVVFRRNGVQTLVEFDSLESSRRAKDSLNGCDIYSGCCTLKIEYGKAKKLNVLRNDADNFDCELSEAGTESAIDKRPLLKTPADDGSSSSAGTRSSPGGRSFGGPSQAMGYNPNYNDSPLQPGMESRGLPSAMTAGGNPRPPLYRTPIMRSPYPSQAPYAGQSYGGGNQSYEQGHQQVGGYRGGRLSGGLHHHGGRGPRPSYQPDYGYGSPHGMEFGYGGPMASLPMPVYSNQVLLVNNLNSAKMNCQTLFNFLCVYGNVHRIKFLKSREGCAMAQMDQIESLDMFLKHINNVYIFGNKISITFSKQEQLDPVMRPFSLPDGTPSYIDFSKSRNNRYLDEKAASKNRPVAPTNTLYYFNTPPDAAEEDVLNIFESVGATKPIRIKNFVSRKRQDDSQQSSGANMRIKGVTGLAEWNNISDAADTLVLANNYEITHQSSKWPFVFKMTFSSAPISGGYSPQAPTTSARNDKQPSEKLGAGERPTGNSSSGMYKDERNPSWPETAKKPTANVAQPQQQAPARRTILPDGAPQQPRPSISGRPVTRWNHSSDTQAKPAAALLGDNATNKTLLPSTGDKPLKRSSSLDRKTSSTSCA